ncbi:MAG: DUF3048 domain-containing protein [Actinobacteria bacterium]|nr:DUF3048 domain-containing protein [Actinomycetota bacterium]
MNLMKETDRKNILKFCIIVFILTSTMLFTGCQTQQAFDNTSTVETKVPETIESVSSTTSIQGSETAMQDTTEYSSNETFIQDETTVLETVEKFSDQLITGNINIFSGLEISDKILNSRPIVVMIENTPDARPQSGLINADIVFEVVDEGGITRFVAVFSSYDAALVGPVRSSRPYYAEIARGLDPVYVFWGTATQFYKIIEMLGLNYFSPLGDQTGYSNIVANLAVNGIDSKRDPSRVSPHNAYTFTPRIKELAKKLGYSLEGGQSPLLFKLDASGLERGDISKITVDFSSSQYITEFNYDSESNTYVRSVAGSPSIDRESGKQITLNNIIVMVTDIVNSGDKAGHMIVRTTQQGNAYYFFDGKVLEGTWSRYSALKPYKFKDKNGNTVLFNRGKTWIAVVSGVERLNY